MRSPFASLPLSAPSRQAAAHPRLAALRGGPLQRRRTTAAILLPAMVAVALAGSALGALPSVAVAQSRSDVPGRPPAPSAAAVAVLFEGLELTAAQRTELAALTDRGRAERARVLEAKAPGSALTAAERVALERSVAAQQAAVEAVLTPAQRARLAANRTAVRTAWEREQAREQEQAPPAARSASADPDSTRRLP